MFAQLVLLFVLAASGTTTADRVLWHWHRDTQICSLRDEAGGGETIEVGRTPANNQTGISITTKAVSNLAGGHFPNSIIELEPGGKVTADVYEYVADGKARVAVTTQDPTFMQKFSQAAAIRIFRGDVAMAEMPLQASAAVADALGNCEDQKMRDWGIDPARWRALKSAPVPITSLMERFSAIDYPTDALSFLVTGDAVTRLDIDTEGHVKQCRSLNASQYKGFEDATCGVLKGAKFTPALDSAGNPVPAPYVIDVVFRIGS